MSTATPRQEADPAQQAKRGLLRDYAELACYGAILLIFFKTFVAQRFVIPSASMRETLMIGDHLVVNKFIFAQPQWAWEEKLAPLRPVRRGDIVVFRWPCDREQDWVKRCVAVAGDRVELRDRVLHVNGRPVTGPWERNVPPGPEGFQPAPGPWVWAQPEPERRQGHQELISRGALWADNLGPVCVPEGQIFVLGDNRERDQSADSRYWGFLPVDHLRGRPFMVAWSYREGGRDDQRATPASGPVAFAANFMDGLAHLFTRSRWERTGRLPR